MDPNAEFGVKRQTRWVNKDWTVVSSTKKPGLQEVAVDVVTYADGRVKEFILDGGGQRHADPIKQDFDEDRRKAWDAQKRDQPAEAKPPAPPAEEETRGPQTGPTREVWRGGKWVVEPNPVYQAPSERPEKPPAEGDIRGPQTGPTREVWRGGKWTTEANPVYQAPVDRPDKPPAEGDIRGLQSGPTREVYRGGKWTTEANPVYQAPEAGNKYTRIEQDKDTGKWYGLTKDGKWEETQGGPGATPQAGQTPGAGLPQIIVGQSEAAIRAAHAQNLEEVKAGRMTPAQAANRLQEMFQFANITLNDAQQVQRQLESGRNTGFNVANARLNYLGGGMNDALKFVLDINKNLPEGSPLGANAFVAILTMQMAIAQASGMMDLEIPDNALTPEALARRRQQRGQPAPAPPRLTDPTNRAAIEADRQAALANPVYQATDTMDANGKPREFTPSGSAPLPPATAAATPPPAPMAPLTGGVSVGPAVRPPAPVAPQPVMPGAPVRDDWRADPPPLVPGPTTEPGGGVPDGRQVIPQPVPRAAPDAGGNVQMAPPPADDFPVMAQFQQPQMPAPEQQPAIDWSQSPAMLRTRAQTSVPWRLSDQEIEQMIAAGVPESDIWSIPGRSFG